MFRSTCAWFGVVFFTLALSPVQASPTPVSPQPLQTSPQKTETSADQLFKQGIQQYQAGQPTEAIQSWQQALTQYRQLQNQVQIERTLENLGLVYQRLGDYKQAIAYFQEQLSLAQKAVKDSGKETRHLVSAANAAGNLGSTHRILGNYVKALEFTQQALQIRRTLKDRMGEGLVLANLGNIQAELGKYETAIDLHQQSLKIAQEVGNQRAAVISLNSLGALYASQGKYAEAQQAYEQSLKKAQEINFALAIGSALNNLGAVLQTQGNYQQSFDYYRQSLEVANRLNDSRMLAAALGGLGLGYVSLQNYPKAIEYQQQGLALAKKLGDLKLEGITASNLGYTLWRSGNLSEAEKKLQDALNTLESLRLNLNDPDKVSIIDTQFISYNILQQIYVAQKNFEQALEIAERSRARAFVDLLSRRLQKQEKTLQERVNKTEKQSALNVESITIDQIRQIAKAQNATLVEYAIATDAQFVAQGKLKGTETHLFIWVVQPSGKISFRQVDLKAFQKPDRSLAQLVSIARNCLYPSFDCRAQFPEKSSAPTSPTTQPTRRRNLGLQQLHELLIQPIEDLLPTEATAKVVFIPQEALFLVPFPALQDANGSYLIEKHTPLTIPAIQVLALTREAKQQLSTADQSPSQRFSPALVVGNPTMPLVEGEALSPLPLAEEEAKEVGRLLKGKVLLGSEATYRSVVQQMTQARLIHLATHGLLEYGQTLGETDVPGAIALAPDSISSPQSPDQKVTASQQSGLLTASEILDLRLQAEIVVLSACDTGRGRITGDGVIGLSRAFISAGVPSVVVSLWAVSDVSTARLMVEFYQNLQQQHDKARALRWAMLQTMKEHPRPIDWAAFTLIGEAE